jgi:hypothetical protein
MKNVKNAGTRLVELRRSNAAGRHDSRPRNLRTRTAARRAAISDSRRG